MDGPNPLQLDGCSTPAPTTALPVAAVKNGRVGIEKVDADGRPGIQPAQPALIGPARDHQNASSIILLRCLVSKRRDVRTTPDASTPDQVVSWFRQRAGYGSEAGVSPAAPPIGASRAPLRQRQRRYGVHRAETRRRRTEEAPASPEPVGPPERLVVDLDRRRQRSRAPRHLCGPCAEFGLHVVAASLGGSFARVLPEPGRWDVVAAGPDVLEQQLAGAPARRCRRPTLARRAPGATTRAGGLDAQPGTSRRDAVPQAPANLAESGTLAQSPPGPCCPSAGATRQTAPAGGGPRPTALRAPAAAARNAGARCGDTSKQTWALGASWNDMASAGTPRGGAPTDVGMARRRRCRGPGGDLADRAPAAPPVVKSGTRCCGARDRPAPAFMRSRPRPARRSAQTQTAWRQLEHAVRMPRHRPR